MLFKIIDRLSFRHKIAIAVYYDVVVALISFPLAFLIRLDQFHLMTHPYLIQICLFAFFSKVVSTAIFKVHRGIWRFASINDLLQIIKTATISSMFILLALFFFTRLEGIPRSVVFIDWSVTILLMSAGRFSFRVWKERTANANGTRTIIIGAGRSGEQLVREIRRDPKSNIKILGILDDAPTKQNRTVHGFPILGKILSLEQHAKELAAEQVIIAIPSAPAKTVAKVLKDSNNLGLKTLILPGMEDIVEGKVSISKLRPINIEDLLGREPVKLDQSSLVSMINDKTILVTGAGGSIGSELCRQLLKFGPKQLLLFDICEFFIYKLHLELTEQFPSLEIIPVMGDVRERARLEEVMQLYRPSLVFHAAAYKHVPMMELNPYEAVKTNVFGTKNVAELSSQYEVERFILISTDKAVNPTNVMGSTKRIAEQICQSVAKHSKTKFAMVRFGNVLGSSGSVVPRFWDQIKSGGPVTVTHPEITRYFMSIPEAAQLVIQTGAIANGGEIFVLDMGEPIKIVHLAKGMIRLSGAKEEDIEIKFTGLRPGEKLYEELLADKEHTLDTSHEKIRIAQATMPHDGFISNVDKIFEGDCIRTKIKELVPEYHCGESKI